MDTTELFPNSLINITTHGDAPAPYKPSIRVKELSERDRRGVLMHFLDLSDSDRLLRFGNLLPDHLITKYVQKLNFTRDTIFGVFDRELNLVGVGHLAFIPRQALPVIQNATTKERAAEFGVSVSGVARGKGVGSKLFERAAIHCRNADVDTLYIHCLSSNQPMMHIAVKAGMQIHRDHGESDSYLKLQPASVVSMMQEAVDEQMAALDHAIKSNAKTATKWLGNVPGFKSI